MAHSLILKNTTLSDIYIVGRQLVASGQDDFSGENTSRIQTDPLLLPAVDAGDIIVNDGTTDLTAVFGRLYIEHGFVAAATTVQENDVIINGDTTTINFAGNIGVVDDGAGKVTITAGQESLQGHSLQSLFVGGLKDSWMFLGDSNSTPPSGPESLGAVSPAVFAADVEAFALTYSNKNPNVDVDAEFYRNGTLIFTWIIRNAQTATKTTALSALTFSAGDRLGIFLSDVGTGNDADQVQLK